MKVYTYLAAFLVSCGLSGSVSGQVVINEGSNRNYSSIADEDTDHPDWIELYNKGNATVNLSGYTLTDDLSNPSKWQLPAVELGAGEYRTVFCSGKDRKPLAGFINVRTVESYTPTPGWNTHVFTTPFYWDGTSNILINTCSYSSLGYTSNSVFNQTATAYYSTVYAAQDGSPISCTFEYGTAVKQRPNIKLNGRAIGTGHIHNSPYDYPAPYGNWYWGAKNQMLIRASELISAGLSTGFITNMAFSVVSSDPNTVYDYIDINMKLVNAQAVTSHFETVDPNNYLHTNFKISNSGETIFLLSPNQVPVSSLHVNCSGLDNSRGLFPDGAPDDFLFETATPSATNNQSYPFLEYLLSPVLSALSGMYESPVEVTITNPNTIASTITYTLDGSDPTPFSTVYDGQPITIQDATVLKAAAFASGYLPAPAATASYMVGVNHSTPVLSVVTDDKNLYGENGIFDFWWMDWQKPAYMEYFDSTKTLLFSQRAGMQMDGGAGGSRANPQHSFRLEADNSVLGDGPVNFPLIPDRPGRNKYSQFYLRNGSNQYLVLPYKDAAEVSSMGHGTKNYYSSWRPVTVYLNGSYFGLYELREKFDKEYFKIYDNADGDSLDLLSLSYWYGGVLRPLEGSVEAYWASQETFRNLNPADTSYWNEADKLFYLEWYTDYIIGESWIANTDWPYNNIKIYRSDKTGFRWRFCLIDMELSLQPNGWTDYTTDLIRHMLDYDPNNPYINIWQKSMLNGRYKNYFINRYADVMNTAYLKSKILANEGSMFSLTNGEMPNEFARWGDPNNVPGQMMAFLQNHITFRSQLTKRTDQVKSHILSNFNLPNLVDVTLDVYPPGSGTIRISTVIPDGYPWQGVYFNGIPVTVEAIPAEGYSFLKWESNGLLSDTLNPLFTDTLNTGDCSFMAYFISTVSAGPERQSAFILYPNPTRERLNILYREPHAGGPLSYELVDMNGRIMKSGKLESGLTEWTIDTGFLPPAVYLCRIRDSRGDARQSRFVKMAY